MLWRILQKLVLTNNSNEKRWSFVKVQLHKCDTPRRSLTEKATKVKENRCSNVTKSEYLIRKLWQRWGRLWWGLRSVCRVLDAAWPKQSRTRCQSLCGFNHISPVIEFSWGFGLLSDSTVLILGKRTGSSLTLWI